MSKPELRVLPDDFIIHRLPADAALPPSLLNAPFCWIGRTDEELSIVCRAGVDVPGSQCSAGWACLQTAGPLDFSLTGILAGIAGVLAQAEISIFALSTFDTDYVLVRRAQCEHAVAVLTADGYDVA